MKIVVRILSVVLLTVGVLAQTGCGGGSVSKDPFVKIGASSVELKGEFTDTIKNLYDNNCVVVDGLSNVAFNNDGKGYNRQLKKSDSNPESPIIVVGRPKSMSMKEDMDFSYTSYGFMKKYFEDKDADVSFVNDVRIGDAVDTVAEKFEGKGLCLDRIGFIVFIADGKVVDMDKYVKMANDYCDTSAKDSHIAYFTGRTDLSMEELKSYSAYTSTYGILANPISQINAIRAMSDIEFGVADESRDYFTGIYASLFAAMDLSGKFTDNEIKNLYSLEVDLDGNVVCHVATRYEYMADWEEQYLE